MKPEKKYRLVGLAKELRRDMTPQERKLWYLFLRQHPAKFYKQRIIDSYIVDFYCASAHLVIELDGSQHYVDDGPQKDALRSNTLHRYGLEVLRFSNRDVDRSFNAVCEKIHQVVQERSGKTFSW